MKKIILLFTLVFSTASFLNSQSNPDDFWLNNGFTDGQTVITNAGWFYDDGGNDIYQQNQDWDVTFCSENGNPISLDFSNFKTHFGGVIGDDTYDQYDYLRVVYPGADYVIYHDDTPEFSFTSQSGCMNIAFHSDGDGQIDSGWVAEIYALPPPFNNDPTTAEDLVVGNVCSPSFYTNKGAFNTTGLESPPCKEYFGGDVWFRAVVPASGVLKLETFAGTLKYAILDIYRSANTTILNSERIACIDGAGGMPSVTLGAPTVSAGQIIYIRLFGEQAKSGLFGICASDPSGSISGFTGPGGVGDANSLDYWYKIDKGLENNADVPVTNSDQVKTWLDQSGNNHHLIQTNSSFQTVYNENVVNNFGALKFDGSNDVFSLESGSGDAPLNWFAAGAFSGAQRQTLVSIGDALASNTASISRHTDGRYFSYTSGDNYGPALTDGQYYLFQATHQTTLPRHLLRLNGLTQTVTDEAAILDTDGSLQVGSSWNNTDYFNGNLSELIQFNKKLNLAQNIIVNNYLSAKYNISIGAIDFYDYKGSFHYDVAGIGRVNASNTHTKAESAGILSISGADDLGNNEYLFFGHDNGDFTNWNSSNVPAGDTNVVRLDRRWRISLEGSPGEVSISLEKNAIPALPPGFAAYNILVDQDGDFSSGAQTFGPFEIGGELVVNNVPLSSGDYLAVAAVRPVVSFSSGLSGELESVVNPVLLVELNYAISTEVEVDYIVVAATATQGTDYSLLPGSITINPGVKTGSIIPLIMDDSEAEIPDEYFDVEISTTTSGVIAGGITVCRHTIINDDLQLEISASDTIIGECATSTSQLVVIPKGTGPYTFSWTPATGLNVTDNDTVIANPSLTTLYTVELTDALSHTVSASIEIEVISGPTAPLITVEGGTSEICAGDSVNLRAPEGFAAYLWSTMETTDSIWVNTSGTYNLTLTDSFGCQSPLSADVNVLVNSLPAAPSLTADALTAFCDGDSVNLVAQSGYASYLWSDMSVNDSLVARSTGSYFVSGMDVNGCKSPNSDTIEVTVFNNPSQPVVSIDGSGSVCAGDSVKLSIPSGFSSYLWSSGETTNEIYVHSTGNYSVVVSDANSCYSPASIASAITVYALPAAPVITADGSSSFCDGGSVTLNASGTYASYIWSDGTLGQSRFVDGSGEFAVRAIDGNLCSSTYSDSIEVTEFPLPVKPVVNNTGDSQFCLGDSTLLVAPASFAAYLWSNGETNDTLIVKSSGSYSVVITDINGCESPPSDAVSITVHALPTQPLIVAAGSTSFCAGDSIELTAPAGYSAYTWSNGASAEHTYISESGPVTVFVEDANGCLSPESAPVSITENSLPAKPIVSPDGSLSFCDGGSVLLESSGTFPQYTWSDGTSGQSRLIEESGSFAVRVTDANLCESEYSDSIEVTEFPAPPKPVIAINGSLEFCEGDSVELIGPTGYVDYLWSDGATSADRIIKSGGSYSLVVEDINECVSTDSDVLTVLVNSNPAAPLLSASGATSFCEGSSVELEAESGFTQYIWSDDIEGQNRTVSESGTFSVRGIAANTCSSVNSNTIEVIVHDLPEKPLVNADGPLTLITGDSVTLSSSSADAYLWVPDGEITQSIVVKTSGNYALTVENEFGCLSPQSDFLTVLVSDFLPQPLIGVDGELEFCEGGAVSLSGPDGFAEYLWSNGSGGQEISVSESSNISLIVRDSQGRESLPSDEVEVLVFNLPELSLLSIVQPNCAGESNGVITVEASGGSSPYTYTWIGEAETSATLSGAAAGNYEVVLSDLNTCSASMDIQMNEPLPLKAEADLTPAYCPDFSDGSIDLIISGGTGMYYVNWGNGENLETLSNLPPGTYPYQVLDANNCELSGSVILGYKTDICFVIPEIITPNNDGYNDTWIIEGMEVYPDVSIEVFDRWGKRIFYSIGHDTYFDGTFNGKELPMESYHYVIDLHNGTERIVGNITIIR